MKNMYKTIMFAFFLLLTLSFVGVFVYQGETSKQVNTDEFSIGVVTSLSGPGSTLGKPWVQGMQLAVDEINKKGGVNGNILRLFVEDDQMNTSKSVNATQFLLNTQKPDVLTTLFHISAIAMNPLSEQAKLPFISASFARSVLDNPYTFKVNFDALSGCEELIRYAKEQNKYQKLGILMSQTGYNEFCFEGAKKVEEDIAEYWYTFGEKDYRTLLLKAKQDGVDALLTIGIDFEYIEMFDQINELGLDMSFFCATASECIFNDVLAKKASQLEGEILAVDFVDPVVLPQSEFASRFFDAYEEVDGIVLTYAMIGYEQTMMLQDVLSVCTPGDRSCIFEEMKKYKGGESDLSQTIGFNDRLLEMHTDIYRFVEGEWDGVKY